MKRAGLPGAGGGAVSAPQKLFCTWGSWLVSATDFSWAGDQACYTSSRLALSSHLLSICFS